METNTTTTETKRRVGRPTTKPKREKVLTLIDSDILDQLRLYTSEANSVGTDTVSMADVINEALLLFLQDK